MTFEGYLPRLLYGVCQRVVQIRHRQPQVAYTRDPLCFVVLVAGFRHPTRVVFLLTFA
jgi:hypothetical protein